jgi:Ca-activated chloride channel family protein
MACFARFRLLIGLLAFSTILPAIARAQGVLININSNEQVRLPRIWPPYPRPRPEPEVPPTSYKIKSLEVSAKLQQQIAKVQVSQTFVNTGSRQMEVSFVFPLPYDGAVDQLTLLVDGKEFPAKLLDAKAARTMYEEIVRKNQDPALLEWMGTGLFKTSVFPVPPGAERTVTLRYSQLCRNWDGLTDFIFPLSTAKYTSQPVEEVKIQLAIDSDADIKNIYSPTHSVDIKRPDDKHATVNLTAKNAVPTEDFRLFYDVGKGVVGTKVLSYRPDSDDQGYYVLLTSPQIKAEGAERPKKTVVLVLDRSGSMSGDKIEQAKGAAKFVINNLREGDLFNLVAYDSEVESWKPELEKFTDDSRKAALGFVEGIYAGGGTNINGAMTTALNQLKDTKRPNFVIFLTDGLPTVGETNEAKIVANAKKNNQVRARIFDFGVGYDVNSRLLDKLARENFGLSEYVRPNEDIERSVAALYNRIGSPVMTDVRIAVDVEGIKPEDGAAANRIYPKDVVDLFAGEQLVIVGRYKKPGAAKVIITGKVGDKEQKFDFPATLVEKSGDDSQAFIEKLWAVRRVGEILDQIDLNGKNDELTKELVTLSLRHGILTPYTSFIADESGRARSLEGQTSTAMKRLESLSLSEGKEGVEQRRFKEAYRGAGKPSSDSRDSSSRSAPAAISDLAAGTYGDAFGAVISGKEDAAKANSEMRYAGSKVFYRENNRWVDSAVSADKKSNEKEPKTKPFQIKRFSTEYFELVDKHGREVAKFLAMDEPVTIELGGKIYEVE